MTSSSPARRHPLVSTVLIGALAVATLGSLQGCIALLGAGAVAGGLSLNDRRTSGTQIDDQAKAHGISRESVIRDVLLAQQPNKRFARVEEIGALTAFLCTDNAASITGTSLAVDGGWTAH